MSDERDKKILQNDEGQEDDDVEAHSKVGSLGKNVRWNESGGSDDDGPDDVEAHIKVRQ